MKCYKGHWVGYFENGNEPSISTRCREFPDYLLDYQLLKRDSAPWNCYVVI